MAKRHRSSDELGEERKHVKTSEPAFVDDANADVETSFTEDSTLVQITVSLRSTSKASRNDPKPKSYWHQLYGDTTKERESDSDHMMQKSPVATVSHTTLQDTGEAELSICDDTGIKEHDDDQEAEDEEDEEADEDDEDEEDDPERYLDEDSGRSSLDEFAEWQWLEQIDGFASEQQNRVGICDAKLIRRRHIFSSFWVEMEGPSRETSDLAFEMFDRYGRLDRKYYEHSFKRGTGVWGPELDCGDILLFETISVISQKRRRGLGTKIVKAVLDKVREKTRGFFALVRPGYFPREVSSAEGDGIPELLAASKQFWRSLGFRRVGTSSWFAFTDDLDHPSRQLDISEDWDELYEQGCREPVPDASQVVFATLVDPDIPGDQCLRKLQDSLPTNVNDARWSVVNEKGNTILHFAAMFSKPEAVEYIFSRKPDLASVRNQDGDTPLEALHAEMELMRTRAVFGGSTIVRSDKFTGSRQSSIACIGILSGTHIVDLDKLSSEDIDAISSASEEQGRHSIPDIDAVRYTLRLKYGCTCGECIGGFLSPRMRFALLCQAEIQNDIMMEDIRESGPDWVMDNGWNLAFLPTHVKQNLKTNKSMREGFVSTCGHIANCLRQKKIPNEYNVLFIYQFETSEWPPVTKNYLQRGGTVAAVASMLFKIAMDQDECSGDGDHQEVFEDQIEELPQCRNDHEFGFVSSMCGYGNLRSDMY